MGATTLHTLAKRCFGKTQRWRLRASKTYLSRCRDRCCTRACSSGPPPSWSRSEVAAEEAEAEPPGDGAWSASCAFWSCWLAPGSAPVGYPPDSPGSGPGICKCSTIAPAPAPAPDASQTLTFEAASEDGPALARPTLPGRIGGPPRCTCSGRKRACATALLSTGASERSPICDKV